MKLEYQFLKLTGLMTAAMATNYSENIMATSLVVD